ncbi:hypothetical protein ACSVH2_09805 [Flavobacterium sp. RSB2_4_14]|uniref:hypothetical protein n=1 Tax=Flavobacterium sp. RSB2_4_14 TaxID=3447665 RepID=UPI003F33C564
MAKVDGVVEIQGTVKGMTFYRSKDGQLVRAKGGISKKRMKTDPAFQRTRENGVEFGHNAKMSQLIRNSAVGMLQLAKDYRVSSRLSQTMSIIKNLDLVSPRGERNVSIGIQSLEGKKALKGFDFNNGSRFRTVFRGEVSLDTATGIVTLVNFNPSIHLSLPEGATHVSISGAMSVVDFDDLSYQTRYSNKENFPIGTGVTTLTLTPEEIPVGAGSQLFFILIEFFQEINGEQYPLKNNSFNVLHLLDVV